MSADSVVSADGTLTFTEVNAQLTGSTHLDRVIAARFAGPDRHVCQLTSPADWPVTGVGSFLEVVQEAGYTYDPDSRKGVIAVTPKIGGAAIGPIILAVIYEDEGEVDDAIARIGRSYGREVPVPGRQHRRSIGTRTRMPGREGRDERRPECAAC